MPIIDSFCHNNTLKVVKAIRPRPWQQHNKVSTNESSVSGVVWTNGSGGLAGPGTEGRTGPMKG